MLGIGRSTLRQVWAGSESYGKRIGRSYESVTRSGGRSLGEVL